MSLVEQALRKLQAARAAAPALVPPPAHPVPVGQSGTPPARSARVARIDRTELRAQHLLPAIEDERRIAQELRQIKRPLVANALGRGVPQMANGQFIMMASALPGDGKTFTSLNLALSIALEKDVQILLVDADIAKPHISRALGVQSELGLLDVLRDPHLDVESVVMNTDVENFSVLPAGRPSETATELLASPRMSSIVARLGASDRQRIVIFDSPPLLLTTEARALRDMVGQVVLVVRAGGTPQKAVLDAIDMLGEGKSVGLVLNHCDESSRQGYYDYYNRDPQTTNAA